MKVLHDLYKSQNNEDMFKLWFNMNYVEDTIDTITVSVASNFLKQSMQKRGNFDIVLKKLKEITGQDDIKLNIIVKEDVAEKTEKSESAVSKNEASEKTNSEEKASKKSSSSESAEAKKSNLKKHPLLQEEYTFDTFIPGDNSNFAYNASVAVAKKPGKQYNPILL